jgi:hypothetical protein
MRLTDGSALKSSNREIVMAKTSKSLFKENLIISIFMLIGFSCSAHASQMYACITEKMGGYHPSDRYASLYNFKTNKLVLKLDGDKSSIDERPFKCVHNRPFFDEHLCVASLDNGELAATWPVVYKLNTKTQKFSFAFLNGFAFDNDLPIGIGYGNCSKF